MRVVRLATYLVSVHWYSSVIIKCYVRIFMIVEWGALPIRCRLEPLRTESRKRKRLIHRLSDDVTDVYCACPCSTSATYAQKEDRHLKNSDSYVNRSSCIRPYLLLVGLYNYSIPICRTILKTGFKVNIGLNRPIAYVWLVWRLKAGLNNRRHNNTFQTR